MADRRDSRRSPPPDPGTPARSPCRGATQAWPPAESPVRPRRPHDRPTARGKDPDERRAAAPAGGVPSPGFCEELFCSGRSRFPLAPLAPLAGALMASAPPQSDAVKQGYLGKPERNHRPYFVLRAGSHTGPSRLEWYKSREKFEAKSAGKGSNKQGVIYLSCCIGVSRTSSPRKGHTVALYAKDQTLVLLAEDQREQEEWCLALKTLMEEERKDEERGEGVDEEDDGYCTLPAAAFFKEVWPVSVKPRGLGRSKALAGETRLCLTAASLILVRVGASGDLPSVAIPLLSVRRFGHLDGAFFVELGRSAPDGPGEIWMEARDPGNPGIAQHIHEAVRDTVRALRVLPDFSRSPTSNLGQHQALLVSKRSRPKYRDKPATARPPSSAPVQPRRNADVQTPPTPPDTKPREPVRTLAGSAPSVASHLGPLRSQLRGGSSSGSGSYMDMETEHCGVAGCGVEGREEGEPEEGLGYMAMSPQSSHSSSVSPQDHYVTMESPNKHYRPPCPSPSAGLRTLFHSSSSDNCPPACPSRCRAREHSEPRRQPSEVERSESEADRSQATAGRSTRRPDEARRAAEPARCRRSPTKSGTPPSPARSVDGSGLTPPSIRSLPRGSTRLVQAGPNAGAGQSGRIQAIADQSRPVRRSRLTSCLLACLQVADGS